MPKLKFMKQILPLIIKPIVNISYNKIYDGLLDAMALINQINEVKDNVIILDFSEVRLVTPIYVLPLMVFLNSCDRVIDIVNTNEYLQSIKFATGMLPDRMRKSEFVAIMEKYSIETFIPIISFPASKDREDEKDTILSTVESIIVKQLNLSLNVTMGLKYMIGEYIDNIIQHAGAERGFIFAQSYPDKGYVDVCIADNGVTLLGSYKTIFGIIVNNDIEAIQAANRGISTKNLPNAENRGYGIITSKKMLIDGLGGTFVMMSGNALHIYNTNDKRFIETPRNIRWDGTIIALRIHYTNEKFQYINYIE